MKQILQLTGAEMDAVIDDGVIRRSGPDGGPAAGPAATLDIYSPDPQECLRQCKTSFLLSLPGGQL